MANNDITTGTTATTFSPERTATRGEIATFLHRNEDEPPVVVDPLGPACYPWHRGAPNPTPAAAVEEFVGFIGLTDATLGEFQQGDSRSGEIEIDTAANPGTAFDFPTTTFVRLDSSDNWVVIGAASEAIEVDKPAPDATVASPMRTVFDHNAISIGVVLQVWPDGADEPVVDRLVTSGSGMFGLDTWDVNVDIPPGVQGPATLIYRSDHAISTNMAEPKFVTTQRVVIAQ